MQGTREKAILIIQTIGTVSLYLALHGESRQGREIQNANKLLWWTTAIDIELALLVLCY